MEQRQFFLRDVLTVVFKHLKLIILFPIILFILVGALNYIWPPTYESEAQMRLIRGREVMQSDPTVTPSSQEMVMNQLSVEDLNSEIELLHSTDLLRNVVTDMGLHEDPDFPYGSGIFRAPFKAIKQVTFGILYFLQLLEKPSEVQQAMHQLREAIIIEPVRDSYVLTVRVRLGDKELAHEVLSGVLAEYMEQHIAMFQSEQGVEFFEQLLERTEAELLQKQNDLRTFRTENNISLLDTQKELLLEQYSEAQKLVTQLQNLQDAVGGIDAPGEVNEDSPLISALSSETESPVVREMQLRLLELMLERNRVVQSLGPQHPQVQSLRQQVSLAFNDLVAAIRNTLEITLQRLGEYQEDLNRLNETEARLAKLEQDVAITEADYEFYANKLQEATIARELGSDEFRISSVRVLSPPSVPVDPVWPKKLLNLALALVGGLIAALALAFLLDYLDHGLKTPEDVDYYVKVPPLASFFNTGGKPLDSREAERLAAMLDTISPTGLSQLVQVTSSVAGEGSHQVAIALADAYANDPDAKTLLVDFSGEVPRAKGASVGLTDVLLDQAEFDEVFGANERLIVVSRGSHSEYPTYLWASERMNLLVTELRKRFKHIVFHVGPILQSHDALKLAHYSDGVLLVIKSDGTRREVVNRAVTMVKDSNAHVVGAVLTERTHTIPGAVYRRI